MTQELKKDSSNVKFGPYSYSILGDPTPLARPRLGRKGVYDPQKQAKAKWGIELLRQHQDKPKLEGPLLLQVNFFFGPPYGMSKIKKEKAHLTPYTIRPDLDNCIKWVNDVCNGIVYEDDSKIVGILAFKNYDSYMPRTDFEFQPFPEANVFTGIEWARMHKPCQQCHNQAYNIILT